MTDTNSHFLIARTVHSSFLFYSNDFDKHSRSTRFSLKGIFTKMRQNMKRKSSKKSKDDKFNYVRWECAHIDWETP